MESWFKAENTWIGGKSCHQGVADHLVLKSENEGSKCHDFKVYSSWFRVQMV